MSSLGKKMRSVAALIAGIAVVALAAGVGIAGYLAPDSRLASSDAQLLPGAAASTEGRLSLMCLGGAHRSVAIGVNPEESDEKISGSAGALLAGIDASAAHAQWNTYSEKSADQESASSNHEPATMPITSSLLPADVAEKTLLNAPALTGALSADRASAAQGLLIAGNAHRAETGDLRGLAYNSCVWPTNEQWLVGSSSAIGSSNRLVVANPSRTNIQVHIRAFTSIGEIPLGSSSLVALPAQSVRSIPLEGVIEEDERIALLLSADSGHFAATVQSSILEGFTPAGIEFLPQGNCGKTVTIPALVLPAGRVDLGGVGQDKQSQESQRIDPAVTAAVRIVNPSEQARTASIYLIGGDGQAQILPGGEDLQIAPGSTLDLSLDGIAPGSYAVHIKADGLIAAGAYVRYDSGSAGADLAWLAARTSVTHAGAYIGNATAQLIVTPELGSTAVTHSTIEWTAYAADGSTLDSQKVELSGTTAIDLPAEAAFIEMKAPQRAYAGVFAAEDLGNGTGISWIPLSANAAGNADSHIYFAN